MINKDKLSLILIITFLLFAWASAYTAIQIGLQGFSPESLALMRFFIASIILGVYVLFKKISPPDIKDVPLLFVCGFMGISLYHLTLNWGQTFITAGSASMILDSYPIFVAILSSFILKESINFVKWLGIIVSFLGIILIGIGEGAGVVISPGVLFVLVSTISLSLFDVIQKKLLKKYTPLELTSYFIWSGTFFLMFFSGSLIKDFKTASVLSISSVIYLGVIPGAVAYLVWSKLLSKYPITNISTVFYIVPVFAILIAFVCLNEIPSFISIVGGMIALSGVVVVNYADKIKSRFFCAKKS
ncbi:MAG: EamA family transporter [Candidatus Gastranaerophilales bacterium]|nr:EamA family transporter [Candidatus Gastranaerophilales bacterium]